MSSEASPRKNNAYSSFAILGGILTLSDRSSRFGEPNHIDELLTEILKDNGATRVEGVAYRPGVDVRFNVYGLPFPGEVTPEMIEQFNAIGNFMLKLSDEDRQSVIDFASRLATNNSLSAE
jgi:hypothetical protein